MDEALQEEARPVGTGWGWLMAYGILSLVLGLAAFLEPFVATFAATIVIGIFFLLAGIASIAAGLMGGRREGRTYAILFGIVSLFVGAIIISGIIMAFGEMGTIAAQRIAIRISGPERGLHIAALCTATIRAVALGVIGIAFIQMLLIGIGFVIKGIPGAGILALIVLVLGIAQAPATLVTLPVIIYVLSTEGFTGATIAFSLYIFVAGLADNVLKPLLLGRGVDVPMPVVLIGALGGMVVKGIIGLFLGPVILAVTYKLFWQWVDQQVPKLDQPATPGE